MKIITNQSFLVFLQFFKRDLYIHSKKIKDYIFNYALIYPLTYAFSFAYLQTNTYFGSGNETLGTILFSGNILLVIMLTTYKFTYDLLFDLEQNRYVDYQITVLNPRLVILKRILVASLLTFIMTAPFFPVAKIVLRNYLDTSNTSWLQLMLILYLGSLCCSAYHQCAILLLKKSNQITSLWARFNHILIMLGGFWAPLHTMNEYSSLLGTIMRFNPLLYVSEGLRQAIVGGNQFLSIAQCASMLILFSLGFTVLCWYIFKKRVDHI